jgi:uncharacterized SAM-binding protein YcdF (DUF218 family)
VIRRLFALVLILWVLGFVVYTMTLARPLAGTPTDGVVVLTGAKGRIDRGIALIEGRLAKRMLISGVAPGVRPIDLSLQYKTPIGLFNCCVDIGHEAVDTKSNGDETARWVKQHGYKSVRLVTSDWHMARARMELGVALGDDITVVPDAVTGDASLGMLVIEYNKLLLRRAALWSGMAG